MCTFILPQQISEILPDALGCCPLSKFSVDFVQLLHRSIESILFQSSVPQKINDLPISTAVLHVASSGNLSAPGADDVSMLTRDAGALLTQQPLHTRIDRFSKLIMLIPHHFIPPVRGS